jgi:hypothetical protein
MLQYLRKGKLVDIFVFACEWDNIMLQDFGKGKLAYIFGKNPKLDTLNRQLHAAVPSQGQTRLRFRQNPLSPWRHRLQDNGLTLSLQNKNSLWPKSALWPLPPCLCLDTCGHIWGSYGACVPICV